jgi:hypothetical protein
VRSLVVQFQSLFFATTCSILTKPTHRSWLWQPSRRRTRYDRRLRRAHQSRSRSREGPCPRAARACPVFFFSWRYYFAVRRPTFDQKEDRERERMGSGRGAGATKGVIPVTTTTTTTSAAAAAGDAASAGRRGRTGLSPAGAEPSSSSGVGTGIGRTGMGVGTGTGPGPGTTAAGGARGGPTGPRPPPGAPPPGSSPGHPGGRPSPGGPPGEGRRGAAPHRRLRRDDGGGHVHVVNPADPQLETTRFGFNP